MSLLPSLRITFDKALTTQDCTAAADKLREIKGVLSVSFSAAHRQASVTYTGAPTVVADIRAIPGLIVDTRHRF